MRIKFFIRKKDEKEYIEDIREYSEEPSSIQFYDILAEMEKLHISEGEEVANKGFVVYYEDEDEVTDDDSCEEVEEDTSEPEGIDDEEEEGNDDYGTC